MTVIDLRPARLDYVIDRGDTFADTVTIKEGDPLEPVDVSARVYLAQVRRTPNGALVAEMDIDMTDAATGTVGYAIAADVMETLAGDYTFDFQQDVGGSIRTLFGGKFKVKLDTTHEDT